MKFPPHLFKLYLQTLYSHIYFHFLIKHLNFNILFHLIFIAPSFIHFLLSAVSIEDREENLAIKHTEQEKKTKGREGWHKRETARARWWHTYNGSTVSFSLFLFLFKNTQKGPPFYSIKTAIHNRETPGELLELDFEGCDGKR